MTLLQTQSPAAVLSLLGTEYAAQLASCTDCAGPAELIVTPDPCYGTQPNAEAGWIGYYAVRCPECQVHFPGDTSASAGTSPKPATLDEHRAALQSAVESWNSIAALAA
ncbi:MAG: hypothetical protein ACRYG7_14945 [Janthinobacterium lividum]